MFNNEANYEEGKKQRRMGCLGKTLIFIAIYVIGSVIFFYWVGSSFMDYNPKVTLGDNSVYRIDMRGVLVEQGQEDNTFLEAFSQMSRWYSMGMVQEMGLDDLLRNIELAKTDAKIKGIMLNGGELSMGAAKAKELHDALIDFKTSGKWIYAYAEHYGLLNYYVASAADSIFINPVGSIAWDGLEGSRLYYTRMLRRLGIDVQVFKVGSFKSAVEPFSRTSMSEEDKQQTLQYLEGVWSIIKKAVAKNRHLTGAKLDEYANRVFSLQGTDTYLGAKMVDVVAYRNEVDSFIIKRVGEKPSFVSTRDMKRVEIPKTTYPDKVAVIYAEGTIVDEATQGVEIAKTTMIKHIKDALKADDVKAVVFRVNSPGGSANASEQIWHAMSLFKDKNIPVVVSMGDYAASGGYYISAGADYIIAQPNTLTGSIGIFGVVPNIKHTRFLLGIDYDGVKTNTHSDLFSNLKYGKVTKDETGLMQGFIDRGYDIFTKRCAKGRHKSQAHIKSIAEGRIWLGKDAVGIGLVDQLGSINDAIAKAAELAHLETYSLTYFPKKVSYINEIMKLLDRSSEEEKMILRMKEFLSEPRVMCLAPVIEMTKN